MRARGQSSLWLYGLVAVPFITDWVENGVLPSSPREWLTEVVGGATLAMLVAKVRRDQAALALLARTDPLTGLFNRRSFETTLVDECARARRTGNALSVVFADIDRFKEVNDRHGHAAGDEVLRMLAEAIRSVIRAHVDSAFRLGGDEFAMILPMSTAAQADAVVERIRARCEGQARSGMTGFGFSAGVVERQPEEAADELLRRSDAAMYARKEERRRRPRSAAR